MPSHNLHFHVQVFSGFDYLTVCLCVLFYILMYLGISRFDSVIYVCVSVRSYVRAGVRVCVSIKVCLQLWLCVDGYVWMVFV